MILSTQYGNFGSFKDLLTFMRLEEKEFDCCLKEDTPMGRELETFLSTVLHHYEYLLV